MLSGRFINDLFLVTNRIPGTHVLESTVSGYDANMWESSWRNKGKRLLAYTNKDEDEYIVTDIVILPEDKDNDMDGYAGLLLTKDTCEKGLKKHIIYYRRDSRKTASKAIEQIILVNQSKGELVQPLFSALSCPVNEILITIKTGDIPKQQTSANALPKLTIPHGAQTSNVPMSPVPASGLDGVPFMINPKYDTNQVGNDPVIGGISIISLDELCQKYEYSFTTENKVIKQNWWIVLVLF